MNEQKGNVLFLILIAVALFAALSYAVSSSNRAGSGNITEQQAQLAADGIFQQAAAAQQALMRMQVSGGYRLEDIEYAPSTTLVLNSACASAACRLFHPQGGGLINVKPPRYAWRDPNSIWADKYVIILLSVEGVGTAAPDIVFLTQGLNLSVCENINKRMGISVTPKNITYGGTFQALSFAPWATPGQFDAATASLGEEPSGSDIVGKQSFCYCDDATCDLSYAPQVIFANVLVAR